MTVRGLTEKILCLRVFSFAPKESTELHEYLNRLIALGFVNTLGMHTGVTQVTLGQLNVRRILGEDSCPHLPNNQRMHSKTTRYTVRNT